ncbi:MAG: hypothetical protein QM755_20280 [Luteolibacter sp.]
MQMSFGIWFAIGFVAYGAIGVALTTWRRNRHLRMLAANRSEESICQFVRSLDYRSLDTKVIRAVYESLGEWCSNGHNRHRPFPIRTTDTLLGDLKLDDEDLIEVIGDVAERCKVSLDHCEQNPWYHRVDTAGDLVHFLCAQPKQPLWPAC